MPRVKLNPLMPVVQGKYGEVVFQRRRGKMILIHRAHLEGHKPTEAQRKQRERFRRASAYGKSVSADPAARAAYASRAEAEQLPVYIVALRDALRAPEIQELDLAGYHGVPGDTIRVRATDDFGVVRVEVEIRDARGTLLERGEAQPAAGKWATWLYRATAAAPEGATVAVTAVDRPGNRAERTSQRAA